ncbi:MAG: MOSC N-terminal beta barrel domain-containing protein [Pseudomonadota bacterium]
MTWSLTNIYRHPVKSLGEESLDQVMLETGGGIPWDREWAIVHAKAEWDPAAPGFISGSRNVVNQTQVPRLAQITCTFDETAGVMTLRHPDQGEISARPSHKDDQARLMDWLAPLTEGTPSQGPFQFCDALGVRYTDFEDTHISIATGNSLRALEQHAGQSLEHIRFRMNLWLEGPAAWSELDWVGNDVEIGAARFRIIARDKRCSATNANPMTGVRDTQLPALLQETQNHMDFGVYAQVVRGGPIKCGDTARLV